jgi:hypothetical protein
MEIPLTYIQEVPNSNLGRDNGYSDWNFRGFLQSLQAKRRALHQLGHDHFLPNYFQYIIHLRTYHWTLCRLKHWQRRKINH